MEISNSSELRKFLLQQMVDVAHGKMEVGNAKAVCNLAQQVYNTVKLEMNFASLKTKDGMQKIEPVEWSSKSKIRNLKAA